jgi:methionine synthase I (cobalamin-dependent)
VKTVKRLKKTESFTPLTKAVSKTWGDAKLKTIKRIPAIYFGINCKLGASFASDQRANTYHRDTKL